MTKLFRAAFLLLFAVSTSWASNNLPDLGAPDLKDYDAQTETQLGQAFSTALHTYYDLDYDPETLSYIRRIGEKITSQTGKSRYFNFFVIDNPEINAFAGPNGIIGIHTGLIASARSEDELASVIAHEVAHVTQRHLSRTYEYQSEINMTSIASLIAAILIGTQDPSAGIATYMGGMGLSIQQQLKNSRIHENEADYFGIEYLNEAGYNPYAMGDFFARLSKEAQIYEGSMPEILSTHPVTANRLAKADDRARQFNDASRKEENATLALIQLRLNFTTRTTLDDFQIKNLTNDQACYLKNLKALYAYQNQTVSFDRRCLDSAIESHPHERLYRLLKAQVKVAQNDATALKDYDYLEAIYPSDFSIVYLHAKALSTLGKREQAIKLLETQTPSFHYQYMLYSELAKLYAEKQDRGRTYYYDALASYNIGNTAKTIYLLKQAKQNLSAKDVKLKEKIKRLETELGPMDKKRQPS
jgi:predicted Zn-dependent protease